jgi:hypothetical protein
MYFHQLFNLILLISNVFAASSKNQVIYDECKEQIISLAEKHYKEHAEIIVKEDDKIFYELIESLFRIDANDLLDLMQTDDSDKVLVIIFYASSSWFHKPFLVFHDISSLSHLKGTPPYEIRLKRIFENFRIFFLNTFIRVKDKCFCSNSPNRSTSFDLLRKFDSFWNTRLYRLARQLLSEKEFESVLKQFKDRVRFLDTFLHNDFESLMRYEFKILQKSFHNLPSSLENFIFLTAHLELHLKNFDDPDFVKWLSLLAYQIPEFIVYFFYFSREPLVTSQNRSGQIDSFTSRNIQRMSEVSSFYFNWDKITFKLFFKSILQPDPQIAKLADVIKTKIRVLSR